MLDTENDNNPNDSAADGGAAAPTATTPAKASRRRPAKKAASAVADATPATQAAAPAAEVAAQPRLRAKKATKKVAAPLSTTAETATFADSAFGAEPSATEPSLSQPAAAKRGGKKAAAKAAPTKAASKKASAKKASSRPTKAVAAETSEISQSGTGTRDQAGASEIAGPPAVMAPPSVLFVAPEVPSTARPRRGATRAAGAAAMAAPAAPAASVEPEPAELDLAVVEDAEDRTAEPDDVREAAVEEASGARRRRRRGRRGRGGGGSGAASRASGSGGDGSEAAGDADTLEDAGAIHTDDTEDAQDGGEGTGTHRRRRRTRSAAGEAAVSADDPPNTVVHVRPPREAKSSDSDDGVRGVKGSTRLEAKRQRRRDGRDTSRRRPPILTEAEFLARREAVDRVMAVRQTGERTQIAVLEDDVLVEHYVTRASATSYVGNVYLGRVQNVLPSMEAAFVDIGKGRNGVIYAGEVNWDAAGLEGKSRTIEDALKSGDVVLVQVTKDPIGHKGARLTSQVSLPGRFLVYVPGGGMTGISRKLPDTERHRLKAILKKIVPEDAGVIVRTAAEGASEEELTRDVERLQAQWQKISKKAEKTAAAPILVHGEPDLAIRVVRDVFNEDFKKMIVQGDAAWATISEYVEGVAPDLAERVSRHQTDTDLFHDLRVDEQLMKALDRKVFLPSGGSLVIDRTEAMTVIDVNTGKFIGSGGNLEQTVTRNNLEAAEEIVRQLRLRDVGGIVVIDFIDMVLESNRELVLRRLTECLGRDRTKHQVAEVTSLGLVQMTRKRVGEGLLEAFSEPCSVCHGRGVILHAEPIDLPFAAEDEPEDGDRPKGKRKRGGAGPKKAPELTAEEIAAAEEQRRIAFAAMTAIHRAAHPDDDEAAQAAAEAAFAAVEQAELIGESEVRAEPERSNGRQSGRLNGRGPEAESGAEPESEPESETDLQPLPVVLSEPAPVAVRRRRRAASRPAGPPIAPAAPPAG
jgi:ribonuclease E